jgi:hypothetical protein
MKIITNKMLVDADGILTSISDFSDPDALAAYNSVS